jgi:type I restriction enzyme S subunit
VNAVSQLPLGWTVASINDTGRYINGFAFKPSHWGEVGRPIIRIQNLTDEDKVFNRTTFPVTDELIVRPGEILVSWSATLDAFIWSREEAVLNQHIFRVVPESRLVDPRLLFYLLRWSIWQMKETEHLHGSTMKHINRGPFLAHKIALPPSCEQQRIVAEIEKQFTRLDAEVAALKRVQANLKRYRAAVLKAACEGRLVPTEAELARKEGRSYETGEQLLARILKERRAKWEAAQLAKMQASGKPPKDDEWKKKYKEPEPPDTSTLQELPDGWKWVNLDQVICSGPQNGLYKPATAYGSGTPILRIDDYQVEFCKPREELKSLQISADENTLYALVPSDILLNRVNSPTHLGKCTVVATALCPCVFESNMMRFRVADLINPEWVTNVLQTADGKARLTANAKWAVNQASINQQDVKQTAIPLPPIAEQARILAAIGQQLSITSKLAEEFGNAFQRADHLRQSILKRAFEGKLVAQDPDDEPASAILDRIRTERGRRLCQVGSRLTLRRKTERKSVTAI